MLTTDIESTFNKVEVLPLFAKKNKEEYFAGYTVLSNDKTFGFWSERPKIISNEIFVENIKTNFGVTPQLCWYSKANTLYYSPFPLMNIILPSSETVIIQPMLESINNLDGHFSSKHNIAFVIFDSFFFTGKECTNLAIFTSVLKLYNNIFLADTKTSRLRNSMEYLIPQKYKFSPKLSSYDVDNWSELQYIELYSPIIKKWSEKAFLDARKFSIKLNNYLFGK